MYVAMRNGQNINQHIGRHIKILCYQRILRLYWRSNIHHDEVSNKAPVFTLRMTQLLLGLCNITNFSNTVISF